MRRAYDIDNGVYTTQVDATQPFSLIMMHAPELSANQGKLEELMESFVVHDIAKYFNLNFTDWILQPNDTVLKQIKVAIRLKQRELKDANEKFSSILDQTGQPFIKPPR